MRISTVSTMRRDDGKDGKMLQVRRPASFELTNAFANKVIWSDRVYTVFLQWQNVDIIFFSPIFYFHKASKFSKEL